MRRGARAVAAAAAAFLLATPVPAPPLSGQGGPAVARLLAAPVDLDPAAPEVRRLGPLRYLGGWVLSSDDRRFGAISGLAADGGHLLALSDQGILFRFAAPVGGAAAGTVEILPLAQGPGDPDSKIDRDSESLALAGGSMWIGYENSNEIWRYRVGSWAAEAKARPRAMRRWSANRGAETLAALSGGRFLAVREDVDDAGISDALLFLGDPAAEGSPAVPLRIDPPERERVTDAAELPDGRLLLLTRGFSLWGSWRARLLVGRLPAAAGAPIAVQEAAEFVAPLTRDNMEAVAVAREGGRTIVWIASDDNLNPLQRTLLLKFEWLG